MSAGLPVCLVHLCVELDQSWDVWNVERHFFYSCIYFSLCQVQSFRLAQLDFWYHIQIFLICDIFRHTSLSHTLIIHRLQNGGVACPLRPPPSGCIVNAQQNQGVAVVREFMYDRAISPLCCVWNEPQKKTLFKTFPPSGEVFVSLYYVQFHSNVKLIDYSLMIHSLCIRFFF